MTHTAARYLSLSALVAAGIAGCAHATAAVPASAGASVDCSEVYGKPAGCHVVPCGPLYTQFLGVWTGPFEDYVRALSTPENPVFRPYRNRISYTSNDCLTNPASGETFIIGRETNVYPPFRNLPAQTTQGLLITGRRADGAPFLRTIDKEGRYDYALLSRLPANEGAVWQLDVPASSHPCPTATNPEKVCTTTPMEFRVTDSRDLSRNPANVRNVVVDMTVGPAAHPYWHGVVTRGDHERQSTGRP
ncbi:MAG: hypothetical protein ACREHF_02645 [Rhizomicrobium sp.]